MTDRPALTDFQEHVLSELAEPNQNPQNEWRVPPTWVRSLEKLQEFGLAEPHERFPHPVWSITPAGRDWLKREKP